MKKVFSILLLGILLFNWIGYRTVLSFLQQRADIRLEVELDKNEYDDANLVAIKVPTTHLAYYTNSKDFERVAGTIEMNGVQYKYVKQRIFNDSVELLCIPDKSAAQFSNAKNDFFKIVNDLQQKENKRTNTSSSKNFSVEYINNYQEYFLSNGPIVCSALAARSHDERPTCFFSRIENPPD